MNNKAIAAIIGILIVVVVVAVFATGTFNQKENQTPSAVNNTTPQSNNTTVNAFNMKATMSGPSNAKKGTTVAINCSVSNKGTSPVKNVVTHSQDSDKNLGTINPGETKSFVWNVYIPTDAEVQQDFGPNATVANPYTIGGFGVTCIDSGGSKHTVFSNALSIKLS